jgi:hypothetical protein
VHRHRCSGQDWKSMPCSPTMFGLSRWWLPNGRSCRPSRPRWFSEHGATNANHITRVP